jgi:acetylornithine aminotransferase
MYDVYAYFLEAIKQIPEVIQVKGRGLMLGVEFDFDVVHFVNDDYRQTYFFGNANNKNLLRFYLL